MANTVKKHSVKRGVCAARDGCRFYQFSQPGFAIRVEADSDNPHRLGRFQARNSPAGGALLIGSSVRCWFRSHSISNHPHQRKEKANDNKKR